MKSIVYCDEFLVVKTFLKHNTFKELLLNKHTHETMIFKHYKKIKKTSAENILVFEMK